MVRISPSLILLSILGLASAAKVRTKPDEGALVVDASGKHSNSYLTISEAVAALHNNTKEQKIFIYPGNYTEQVYIPRLKSLLTIQGYTKNGKTYKNNEVVISYGLSQKSPGVKGNDGTATLRLWTPNVKVYNIDIVNTYGEGSQAVALSAQNTNQGFYGCSFVGFQDTVLANKGKQIYSMCQILGAVDFIFGLKAVAWFEKVDIKTIAEGFITANGRDSEDNPSYFVFNKANVTGTSGPASVDLGRPWRPYSRVLFQKCYLSDVIKPRGWSVWSNETNEDHVVFQEHKNHGPGANISQRVPWSSQAKEALKPTTLFGDDFKNQSWVDTDYL